LASRRIAASAMLIWILIGTALGVYINSILLPKESFDSICQGIYALIFLTATSDAFQAFATRKGKRKLPVESRPVMTGAIISVVALILARLSLDSAIGVSAGYRFMILAFLFYLSILFYAYLPQSH